MALRERSVQISVLGIKETAWNKKWEPEHVLWVWFCVAAKGRKGQMQRLKEVKENRDHYNASLAALGSQRSGAERSVAQLCHDGQEHHAGVEHDRGWDSEPGSGRVSGEGPWSVQSFGAWLGPTSQPWCD